MNIQKAAKALIGGALAYIALNSAVFAQSRADTSYVSMGALKKEARVEATDEKRPQTTIQQKTGELISQNDLAKSLQSYIPGYISTTSNSTKAVKDNLDQSNFQTYMRMNGISIPLLGSTSSFRDVLFAFDEDMMSLDFKGSAYSTSESALASSMILKPKDAENISLKISNDLIKRKLSAQVSKEYLGAEISNRFFAGNTGVFGFLESNFESLKLFPSGTTFQDYLTIGHDDNRISAFISSSGSRTSLSKENGSIRGVKSLKEDNQKRFYAITASLTTESIGTISVGAGYQRNTTDMALEMESIDRWKVELENTFLGAAADISGWRLGANFNSLKNRTYDGRKSSDVFRMTADKNIIFGNLLLEGSASLIFSGQPPEKSVMGKVTYFGDAGGVPTELSAGYGNYYEPLSNNNTSTENSLSARDLVEKWSEHYVAAVELKPDMELFRSIKAEYYNKRIIDRLGEKMNRIWVEGINLRLINDYVAISYSHGFDAKQKGAVLPGAIMDFLQVQTAFGAGGYDISLQLSFDDGYYDRVYNANPLPEDLKRQVTYSAGEPFVKNGSRTNINLGIGKEIPFPNGKIDVQLMLGNLESFLLGEKQVVRTVKTPAGLEKIYAPTIGNIGISATYEF